MSEDEDANFDKRQVSVSDITYNMSSGTLNSTMLYSLSPAIRTVSSFTSFRQQLKTHLFRLSFG